LAVRAAARSGSIQHSSNNLRTAVIDAAPHYVISVATAQIFFYRVPHYCHT
jgi:hypothetical protein